MKPTFRKVYRWPHEREVKQLAPSPFSMTTDTKNTMFDGNSDSKLMNTAPMKQRFKTLKTHGKAAFRRTFK